MSADLDDAFPPEESAPGAFEEGLEDPAPGDPGDVLEYLKTLPAPTPAELATREEARQKTRVQAARFLAANGGVTLDVAGQVSEFLYSPVEILRREAYTGPRYPTRIGPLDDLFGGGLAPGSSVAVAGEPFVGKTLLVVQVGAEMAVQGAAVAILANDEDRVGLAQRIGQYLGLPKDELSPEYPNVLEELGRRLAGAGPIRIYPDPEQAVTAEDVARELGEMKGAFRVLVVDSVQTVRVAAHEDGDPEPVAIKKTAEALKKIKKTGILVLATSEAPRGAYGSKDPSQRTRALASFAGSRKVEFLFDVAALLTGEDVPERARLEVAKNRLGHRRGVVGLHLDRVRARFLSVDLGEAEMERQRSADARRDLAANEKRSKNRERILRAIDGTDDGAGTSYSRLRVVSGVRKDDLAAELELLEEDGVIEKFTPERRKGQTGKISPCFRRRKERP